MRWTPKGDAIGFIDYANGVSNICLQPIDGGAAKAHHVVYIGRYLTPSIGLATDAWLFARADLGRRDTHSRQECRP